MQLHHSPATAKKLWNYLRVAFFMARRGFASKRKLMADVNLLMKRGKLLGRSLSGLVFHHRHRDGSQAPPLVRREYEFSCSNSPAYPVFYRGSKRRRCSYFPCLHAVVVEEVDDALVAAALRSVDYSARLEEDHHYHHHHHLAPTPPMAASPLSVRIVSYLSDGDDVDDAAEEFIKRFYEQLRAQSRVALLQ